MLPLARPHPAAQPLVNATSPSFLVMNPNFETILANWRLLRSLVTCCLVLAIAASCTSARSLVWRTQTSRAKANLEIQVAPAAKPGQYTLSGTADLPKGTELTVIAVRYLHLSQSPFKTVDPKPTYSILAYDTVNVEGNRWQTQLELWRVAPSGQFQEAWQLTEPDLALAVEPEAQVVFLATLAPIHDLQAIEQQLARRDRQFASRFVQTTAEGNRYLQTGQVLAVNLPTGTTTPVATRAEDINGGWGNRFLDLPDPPNTRQLEFPDQRQTNAPVAREELLY
ncbi:hypothetical protein [Almyronema epifaneia]|uniref:DUF3122 domain-containing protein n=1 Tax=Almyronema epifaneia S1 TaxID=2991925 RepID=A0ABW6I997_9CYAN